MVYLKRSAIKRRIAESGKRCGKEFLEALDRHVDDVIGRALVVHNGSKKTLDAAVLAYVTGGIK